MTGDILMVEESRLTRLEVHQEHMASAMTQMANAQADMVQTLSRVSLQQDDIARLHSRQSSVDHRITQLEGDMKAQQAATAPLAGLSEKMIKNTLITSIAAWLAAVSVTAIISGCVALFVKISGHS